MIYYHQRRKLIASLSVEKILCHEQIMDGIGTYESVFLIHCFLDLCRVRKDVVSAIGCFSALGPASKSKEESSVSSTSHSNSSVVPSHVNYGAAQMWSLGVIVWELITCQIPFVDMNKFHIGFKVRINIPFWLQIFCCNQ